MSESKLKMTFQTAPRGRVLHITDTGSETEDLLSAWAKHTSTPYLRDSIVSIVPANTALDIGLIASKAFNNPERTERLVLLVNAAPNDNDKGAQNNHRNDFYCALLDDGTVIAGTSAGYEFSYVRDRIVAMYDLTVSNEKGSQFRSRDTLPEYTARFADPTERAKLLREQGADGKPKLAPVNINDVVRLPPEASHVYEVDNSGNVKLYLSAADRALIQQAKASGKKLKVQFAKTSIELAAPKRKGWRGLAVSVTRLIGQDRYRAFKLPVRDTFFAAKNGEIILNTNSSANRSDKTKIEQIVQVRTRHATEAPDFPLPVRGAQIYLTLAA